VATGVGRTCKKMYDISGNGLPPESMQMSRNGEAAIQLKYFIKRPEAVESWLYLWRATQDPKYRQWGWEYFEAMNQNVRKRYGFTGLRDVRDLNSTDNVEQSFFFAETMKYLFLLFCPDDVLPLDEFLFNTEAHPLPLIDAPLLPKLVKKS